MAVLAKALANLRAAFPALAGVTMAESWAGMIDTTPDAVPVISAVESLPGFHIATGFSGHGFGIGPGAGRLAADLVSGATPIVDPHPFRYQRMIDGTKLMPDAGL
jgi:glycine/D-amino acid oxidase-like deaminating enzyme